MGDTMNLRARVTFEAIWPDSGWRESARKFIADHDSAIQEQAREIERLRAEMERREQHHTQARRDERDIGLEIALEEVTRSWGKAPTTDEANRLNELGDRIRAHIGTDRTSELMAEIERLKDRLKENHGEVDEEDASHDEAHDGVAGIVSWVKSSKAHLKETSHGIFDTGFRCVSEGGETFYLDPEELEALQDERDALRAEKARLTLDADRARERHEIEHATMSREVARIRAELERLKPSGPVEPEDLRQALNAADAKTRSGHVIRQHISALNARISSLSPSGPLAEDAKIALGGVPDGPGGDAERAAVHRLAAGAQSAQAKDATIRALADALDGTAPRKSSILGPCWCTHVEFIPPRDDLHGPECITRRAALRLVGRL